MYSITIYMNNGTKEVINSPYPVSVVEVAIPSSGASLPWAIVNKATIKKQDGTERVLLGYDWKEVVTVDWSGETAIFNWEYCRLTASDLRIYYPEQADRVEMEAEVERRRLASRNKGKRCPPFDANAPDNYRLVVGYRTADEEDVDTAVNMAQAKWLRNEYQRLASRYSGIRIVRIYKKRES